MRKPVFGGLTWSHTNRSVQPWKMARSFREYRECSIRVAKTKALISFAVTAKLICVFVFAYAESQISHNEAHIMYTPVYPSNSIYKQYSKSHISVGLTIYQQKEQYSAFYDI